jgi:hypothetical protein
MRVGEEPIDTHLKTRDHPLKAAGVTATLARPVLPARWGQTPLRLGAAAPRVGLSLTGLVSRVGLVEGTTLFLNRASRDLRGESKSRL